jgi:hypothetical protein
LTATTPISGTRYFDPQGWLYVSGSCQPVVPNSANFTIPFSGQSNGAGSVQFAGPFIVDPLYVARQTALGNTSSLYAFPIPPVAPSGGSISTVRVSYAGNLGGSIPLQQAIAERFFLCRDDLTIPVPKDRTERPRQMMTDSHTPSLTSAVPWHPADGPSNATAPYLTCQPQGDYSWLFTVTPMAVQPDGGTMSSPPAPYLNVGVGEYYQVAVAVFYKRNFNPPNWSSSSDIGEPIGQATFPAGISPANPSMGGGDVTLGPPAGFPTGWPQQFNPAWLDVKQNEWILLGGYVSPTPNGVTTPQYAVRWYRIVAVGEISGNTRPVTLAGPDWDLYGSGGNGTADVVLYRGVVDVHTTTIKLTY